ncbi:MAG TPA: VTT domain-containing protein [Candidatus Binatia bacterium]
MEKRIAEPHAGREAKTQPEARQRALLKGLVVFLLLLALPAAWRWTPLNQWINFERIILWQESVQSYPGAFFLVLGAYLLGSLALFPVTILNVATVFTFGPILGNGYALAGWLASAAMGYGIGRGLGWDLLHRMAGPRLRRLVAQAGRRGFIAVLTMRVLPLAPFTLVNLFVGGSGIRFWDFFAASIVGRIPGLVILSLAGVQLEYALRSPELGRFVLIGLALVLIPLVTAWLAKRFASGDGRASSKTQS